MTGAEAAASGWSTGRCRATDVLATALAAADAVAAAAPVATRLTKRALLGGGHASFDAALEWEALAQPVTLATADLQEGLRARRAAAAAVHRPLTRPPVRRRISRRARSGAGRSGRVGRKIRRERAGAHEAPGPRARSARLPLASVPAGTSRGLRRGGR